MSPVSLFLFIVASSLLVGFMFLLCVSLIFGFLCFVFCLSVMLKLFLTFCLPCSATESKSCLSHRRYDSIIQHELQVQLFNNSTVVQYRIETSLCPIASIKWRKKTLIHELVHHLNSMLLSNTLSSLYLNYAKMQLSFILMLCSLLRDHFLIFFIFKCWTSFNQGNDNAATE